MDGGTGFDLDNGHYGQPQRMTVVGRVDASRRERYVKRRLERARNLLREGRSQRAVEVLRSLTHRHPDDPDAWLELSYASRMCGSDDAIEYATKANELAPSDSRTYSELALALSQDPARLDEAIGVVEHGIALDETEALNWAVLGTLRLATAEPVSASLACERALALDPECGEAHYVLGNAAVAFSELNEAADRYRQALELTPDLTAAAEALEWVESQLPSTDVASDRSSAIVDDAVEFPDAFDNAVKPTDHEAGAREYGPAVSGTPQADLGSASRDNGAMTNGDVPAAGSQHGTGPDAPEDVLSSGDASIEHGNGDPHPELTSPGFVGDHVDQHSTARDFDSARGAVLDAIAHHIDAYNRRDIDSLLDGFSEDAVLRTANERFVGRGALHELFTGAFDAPDETKLFMRGAVVENGSAACELTERLYDGDQEYDSEFVGLYTVLAGRIVRARLYHDSQ